VLFRSILVDINFEDGLTLGLFVLGVNFFEVDNYDGTNSPAAPGTPYAVFDSVSRTLYADDDASDPGYAVIATVPNGHTIVASDVEIAAFGG